MTEDLDELHVLLQYWIVYSDHFFLCRYLYWMLMPYTHTGSLRSSNNLEPSCRMLPSAILNMQFLVIELQRVVKIDAQHAIAALCLGSVLHTSDRH